MCGSKRVSRKSVGVTSAKTGLTTTVLAEVCPDCGERYYDMEAMRVLLGSSETRRRVRRVRAAG